MATKEDIPRRSPRLNGPGKKASLEELNASKDESVAPEVEQNESNRKRKRRVAVARKLSNNADAISTDQFRANMISFARSVTDLKAYGLMDSHLQLLFNSPFRALFEAYSMERVNPAIHRILNFAVLRILQRFDPGTRTFAFKNGRARLTPEWVSKILGIPNSGRVINFLDKQACKDVFLSRTFKIGYQIQKAHIVKAIINLLKGNNSFDLKDLTKLLAMLLVTTLLLRNTGTSLPWYIVKYLVSVDEMRRHNWAKAVCDWLVESMAAKFDRPSTVFGCVPVLLCWFCEVTVVVAPIAGSDGVTPGFLKWDLRDLYAYMRSNDVGTAVIREEFVEHVGGGQSVSKKGDDSVVELESNDDFTPRPITRIIRRRRNSNGATGIGTAKGGTLDLIEIIGGPSGAPLRAKGKEKMCTPSRKKKAVTGTNIVRRSRRNSSGTVVIRDHIPAYVEDSSEARVGNQDPDNVAATLGPDEMLIMSAEVDTLRHALRMLEDDREAQVKGKDEEIRKLRVDNSRLYGELDKLQGDLNTLHGSNEDYVKKFDLVNAETVILRDTVKELDEEILVLKTSNDDLLIQNRTLKEQLKSIEPMPEVPTEQPDPSSTVKALKKCRRRGKHVQFVDDSHRARGKKYVGTGSDRKLNELVELSDDGEGNNNAVPEEVKEASAGTGTTPNKVINQKLAKAMRSEVAKYLQPQSKEGLKQLEGNTDPGFNVIEVGLASISMKDIEDLLTNSHVSTNVIDTYAMLLYTLDVFSPPPGIRPVFLSTYAWRYLRDGKLPGAQRFLFDALLESIMDATHIFVPMHHDEKQHFTLLYLDKEARVWNHMNPLHPRRLTNNDQCYKDAVKMHAQIQKFLVDMKHNSSKILVDGKRSYLNVTDNGKATYMKPITDKERSTMQWSTSANVNFPIHVKTDCPQQGYNTVDCAIEVMYYMREIVGGTPLVHNLSSNAMKWMRAHIVDTIIKAWKNPVVGMK